MRRYEILILTVPEITQDETKMLETKFEQVVKNAKGTVMSFERWGKYRLTYPVKKNDYGVYFLTRFEVKDAPELLENLKTLLAVDFHAIVMRQVTAKLEIEQPLAYQRPQSLEEAPKKEVGVFSRGHGGGGGGRRPFSRPGSDRGAYQGSASGENKSFSRQDVETSSPKNDDQSDREG